MTWDDFLPDVKTSWRPDLTDLPRLVSVTFVPVIGRQLPDPTCVFDKFLGWTAGSQRLAVSLFSILGFRIW